jgi:HPt (histidine-containing phosphotransfer) domain-containing protein
MVILRTTGVNAYFIHKHELSTCFYVDLLHRCHSGRARHADRALRQQEGDAYMATLAVASASNTLPLAIPRREAPIDRGHLARYTFGNCALEIEVLQLFAEQAPHYLEALRAATAEESWRNAAHTLKGSARAVGAFRVADRAEWAETLWGNADAGVRAWVITALEEALDEARSHIAMLLAQA